MKGEERREESTEKGEKMRDREEKKEEKMQKKVEGKRDEEEKEEQESGEEERESQRNSPLPPRPLHKTQSLFLRSLPPTICKQDIVNVSGCSCVCMHVFFF